MSKDIKITVISNFCAHYRKNIYERLAQVYAARFIFFSDGKDTYWESKNRIDLGDFEGEYLKGFWLTKKVRITPDLIPKLLKDDSDVIIKDITGRFALPVTFLITKIKKVPFILWTGVWQHPKTFFHTLTFPLMKWIYQGSDAVCVYGTHVKEYLSSLGVDPKKMFIAAQAVDNAKFSRDVPLEEKQQLKAKLNIGTRKVILFVGQMEVRKGIYYLIDAVEKLDAEKVAVILLGNGSHLEDVKRIVEQRNMKQVIFLDYVDNNDLYRYYSIADIFVLPSITTANFKEPWGLVVNEAMNQGCPIVTTTAVGAAAGGLVKDGVNGYVVPEKDPGRLFQALDNILTDDDLSQSMRNRSKDMIKNWTDEERLDGIVQAVSFSLQLKRAGEMVTKDEVVRHG
ncbi:MAG: hypothetical protein A2Z88_06335 [Omnitrophica WOR_2 bacterium GWA2_47_8]|nr:MAG: hypothetical protein A2Z88_06335 [Omnitrophica WOR_2 bacterium GWA2_47_8]